MRHAKLTAGAIAAMGITGLPAGPALASDMVYTPANPSFGGNPFNSTHLLAVANAINKYKDPAAIDSNDPAQQFLRTIQNRLVAAVSNQIVDLIFGENAQDSGTVRFGDQQIDFVRGAETVTLTITNDLDGSVTEIVVPLLSTSPTSIPRF
jgi:curli production assembly/transport component CsgF